MNKELSEFDKRYYGCYPASADEIDVIIDELAEIIQKAYEGTNVEITDFDVYHSNPDKNGDAHSYRISWYVQKDHDADETEKVHCVVRRLSPTVVEYWRPGKSFIYTASAHTTKRVCQGRALANDKSVFRDNVADITDISINMLEDILAI